LEGMRYREIENSDETHLEGMAYREKEDDL
jgi:hypothetical protein